MANDEPESERARCSALSAESAARPRLLLVLLLLLSCTRGEAARGQFGSTEADSTDGEAAETSRYSKSARYDKNDEIS